MFSSFLHARTYGTIMKCLHAKMSAVLFIDKVVLEPRVSPENTSKSVDTVTFLQKLEPKVIDP